MEENAFAVLGLAPRYAIEEEELERRQRELYVARSAEGLFAVEAINAAHDLLRDPVARAELLFALLDWPTRGAPDPELLAWVFAEREQVDEALARGDEDFLWDWISTARKRRDALMAALSELLDGPRAPEDGFVPGNPPVVASGDTRTPAERALVLLDELRYLSRALSAAQQAVEAMEDVPS